MSIIKLFKSHIFLSLLVISSVLVGSVIVGIADNLLTPSGNALRQQDLRKFVWLMLISTGLSIIGGVIKYCANYFYTKEQQLYIHQVRKRIVKYYWHENKEITSAQNRLTNDINIVSQNLLDPYFKILACSLDVIISAFFIYSYNKFLLILILIFALIILLLPKILSKPVEKATYAMSNSNKRYLNTIGDWFNGLDVLQRYKRGNIFERVLSKSSNRLEQSTTDLSKKTNTINSISYIANILAQGIILAVTGILIIHNIIEFGVFFSIGNFASTIFTNLVVVANNITLLNSSHEINDEIKTQLLISEQNTNGDNKKANIENVKTIYLNKVTIQVNSTETIRYPNIKINKGDKVLLLGNSGTGKSTLFKLLLDIYHPTSGKIVFKDAHDKEIKPDLNQIGYIPQDPVLFPGTVEDNITLFNKNLAKKAEYWAEMFDLANDLQKFPQGIKSKLDLNNNTYSGGQRQKIILARAKTYDSKMLLIDEGTSAIDSTSSLKILKQLLNTDDTIIFIAHNISEKMMSMFDKKVILK